MTATITGPAALDKGQLGTYTVTATKPVPNGTPMGIDVAASDAGSLSVVSGQPTSISGNDLHHNISVGALRTTSANSANYQFNYTMPAGATVGTTHTLYAVAAIDFNGGWRHAANFSVLTRPVAPTSVTASNVTTGSVDLSWAGTGPEYRVVYKTGAVAPTSETDGTFSDHGASTSTPVTGLTASTQYSFAVFSKLSGSADFSTSAATTTATTGAAVTAPRYVNASTGVNTGNCASLGSPCKTITYAMAQAVTGNPGDSINVAPGTYNAALGEVFPIVVKSGVQLQSTGTAANTIIDATGANARIFNASGVNSLTYIYRFTLTGGFHQPAPTGANAQGGAILIESLSQIRVSRNLIIDNEARGYTGVAPTHPSGGEAYGGAIASFGSSPVIENNIFIANTVQGGNGVSRFDGAAGGNAGNGHGGAIFIGGGAATVINNTFHGNEARGGAGGSSNASSGGSGGIAFNGAVESAAASIVSNLFANNIAVGGSGGGGSPSGTTGNSFNGALNDNGGPLTAHNLFFGNSAASNGDTQGTNAVLANPQFHSSVDFHITHASPAKAAGFATGAPPLDYDGVTRPSPPAIGALEPSNVVVPFQLTVSKSGTGSGTVTSSPAGINCGATCAANFNSPTVVTLTPTPASGSLFTGWSGVCSGTGTCNVTMSAARSVTAAFGLPTDIPRVVGISTRLQVLTGDNVLIGGVIVGGSSPKTVVVRARGPSLGVAGALADPTLTLVPASGPALTNDDWGTASNAAALSASGYAPANAKESAIMITLSPGAYTAVVGGVGNTTGIAIVEVYEIDEPQIPLTGISTRGFVQPGDNVMIGGFIIQGDSPQTVVIRARGPSLTEQGVAGALQNPTLTLVPASGPSITNDNWQTASNASTLLTSGYAPSDSRESAILITLAPGAYTAVVSGVGGTTGVALVEVYVQ